MHVRVVDVAPGPRGFGCSALRAPPVAGRAGSSARSFALRAPSLAWRRRATRHRLDERVAGFGEVRAGVLARRGVAAPHVSADEALSDGNPALAFPLTRLAARALGRDVANLSHMFAVSHGAQSCSNSPRKASDARDQPRLTRRREPLPCAGFPKGTTPSIARPCLANSRGFAGIAFFPGVCHPRRTYEPPYPRP